MRVLNNTTGVNFRNFQISPNETRFGESRAAKEKRLQDEYIKSPREAEPPQETGNSEMDADAKALIIAMRIMRGDNVPKKDEDFLFEHNPELYMKAIKIRAMTENQNPKDYDSLFEDEEDNVLDVGGNFAQNFDIPTPPVDNSPTVSAD
ncbi:MAG: hypothetical protein FWE23_11230 [Chitinivibrionia bacterium]|nr:hypothetical protein [Chitinivibrionia bacterium]